MSARTIPIWSIEAHAFVETPVRSIEADALRPQAVVSRHFVDGDERTYFFEHGGSNWMSRWETGRPISELRELCRRTPVALADVREGIREIVEEETLESSADFLVVGDNYFVRTLGPALVLKGGPRQRPSLSFAMPDCSDSYGHHFRDGRVALSAYDLDQARVRMLDLSPRCSLMGRYSTTIIDSSVIHDHVAAIGARMSILAYAVDGAAVPLAGGGAIEATLQAREYVDAVLDERVWASGIMNDRAGGIYERVPHDDRVALEAIEGIASGLGDDRWGNALRLARDRLADHVDKRGVSADMQQIAGIGF